MPTDNYCQANFNLLRQLFRKETYSKRCLAESQELELGGLLKNASCSEKDWHWGDFCLFKLFCLFDLTSIIF